ncbi:hypothetical protein FPV67DRAFT_1468120 [Lyophyllum atratum]|nr:hypothetical protein FPV67DRAFT_1468120 [Lyophyllum atratum]
MFAKSIHPAGVDQTSAGTVPCRYRAPFVAHRGGSDTMALTFLCFLDSKYILYSILFTIRTAFHEHRKRKLVYLQAQVKFSQVSMLNMMEGRIRQCEWYKYYSNSQDTKLVQSQIFALVSQFIPAHDLSQPPSNPQRPPRRLGNPSSRTKSLMAGFLAWPRRVKLTVCKVAKVLLVLMFLLLLEWHLFLVVGRWWGLYLLFSAGMHGPRVVGGCAGLNGCSFPGSQH